MFAFFHGECIIIHRKSNVVDGNGLYARVRKFFFFVILFFYFYYLFTASDNEDNGHEINSSPILFDKLWSRRIRLVPRLDENKLWGVIFSLFLPREKHAIQRRSINVLHIYASRLWRASGTWPSCFVESRGDAVDFDENIDHLYESVTRMGTVVNINNILRRSCIRYQTITVARAELQYFWSVNGGLWPCGGQIEKWRPTVARYRYGNAFRQVICHDYIFDKMLSAISWT